MPTVGRSRSRSLRRMQHSTHLLAFIRPRMARSERPSAPPLKSQKPISQRTATSWMSSSHLNFHESSSPGVPASSLAFFSPIDPGLSTAAPKTTPESSSSSEPCGSPPPRPPLPPPRPPFPPRPLLALAPLPNVPSAPSPPKAVWIPPPRCIAAHSSSSSSSPQALRCGKRGA
eukprot:scaffold280676_cov27-Tisochrysis_lutea.AAC.3